MKQSLTGSSIVAATKNQVFADLSGEAAILDLQSGLYYGLNGLGSRIWNLVQEPMTVNDIRDHLLREYEVESDRCERELLALLQQMMDEGLVEIRPR
jgi:hypothetical protein